MATDMIGTGKLASRFQFAVGLQTQNLAAVDHQDGAPHERLSYFVLANTNLEPQLACASFWRPRRRAVM